MHCVLRHAVARSLPSAVVQQHGLVKATVAQQLVELATKSPQMWKETQQRLTEQLKSAQKEARDAKKGTAASKLHMYCHAAVLSFARQHRRRSETPRKVRQQVNCTCLTGIAQHA